MPYYTSIPISSFQFYKTKMPIIVTKPEPIKFWYKLKKILLGEDIYSDYIVDTSADKPSDIIRSISDVIWAIRCKKPQEEQQEAEEPKIVDKTDEIIPPWVIYAIAGFVIYKLVK